MKAEIPMLAARIRLAGERLDAAGGVLWERSLGWKHGPQAAKTEPGGGWRYECSVCGRTLTHAETCMCAAEAEPVAIDSTGETAVRGLGPAQDILRMAPPSTDNPSLAACWNMQVTTWKSSKRMP